MSTRKINVEQDPVTCKNIYDGKQDKKFRNLFCPIKECKPVNNISKEELDKMRDDVIQISSDEIREMHDKNMLDNKKMKEKKLSDVLEENRVSRTTADEQSQKIIPQSKLLMDSIKKEELDKKIKKWTEEIEQISIEVPSLRNSILKELIKMAGGDNNKDIFSGSTPYFDMIGQDNNKKETPSTLLSPQNNNDDPYYTIMKQCMDTYTKKNHDYTAHGKSAFDSGWDKMGIKSLWLRLNDKFQRFTNGVFGDEDYQVSDETIKDTLMDMINYCAMGIKRLEQDQKK